MKTKPEIHIDGSQGEGGGQMLRTALALSVVTGKAFRISNIRANREKPGLMRQHLTCVHAASEISGADVSGAELHSTDVTFEPKTEGAKPGSYHFAVGTAGSTSLVLQTILLPLLLAHGKSEVRIEGGTHNPMAPTFHFIEKVYLAALRKMGATVSMELERVGFVPAGGGLVRATISGGDNLKSLILNNRGKVTNVSATAFAGGGLSGDICKRELKTIAKRLHLSGECLNQRSITDCDSQGNFIMIEVESEQMFELFTAIGQHGKRAENVANQCVNEVREYINCEAPVGLHLADQLLLPMALGRGGTFVTSELTLHSHTNTEIIRQFLPVEITAEKIAGKAWLVTVQTRYLNRSEEYS